MLEKTDLDLTPDEIAALSSPYIDQGIKQEAWEITSIRVKKNVMNAKIRMSSVFLSPTDPDGFHLSIFATQEILGQLANIFLHVAGGLKVKTRESWMRECSFKYKNVIRSSQNINVEMICTTLKPLGDSLFGICDCKVTDDQGGLFVAQVKGVLR
jgi:hypothetical protein